MRTLLEHWQALLWSAAILAGAVSVALVVHRLVFIFAKRVSQRTGSVIEDSLVRHGERPTRWIFPFLALVLVLPMLPFRSDVLRALQHAVGLGLILSMGWVCVLLADVFGDALYARYRIDVSDNLAAGRVRTQIHVLRRIFVVVVIIVTAAAMLMTFPAIHQLGTSLLASAGLAGLIVGMAMKSTLSSLIAGLQIAFTEPIRIEDVVIVQGEFGWIEEIETTYVIIRTWDLRRLVVPLSYFIENPFQNWTRLNAQGEQTASCLRPGVLPIRQRKINKVLRGRPAPLDPAQWTATAYALLPYDPSQVVRIEGMNYSGFLGSNQQIAGTGTGQENGRRAKIEITSRFLRTIGLGISHASDVPTIVWSQLLPPQPLSGIHVESDYRIRVSASGVRVAVTRRHVNRAPLEVSGGRGPHGRTRRSPQLYSQRVLSCGVRRIRNRVRLPNLFSRAGVERDYTSAKGTTGVMRICGDPSSPEETGT